ncbi:MAG TPA: aldo/keto reductase, partial [Myxococcota bacterium]|nr:aldo/keto reductase [Myxococcota bacterium]
MIPRMPFGRTGHESSRVLFGAAALGAMRQDRADAILEQLLEFGINHIDTAAAYGDSELRVGAWMARHRDRFFLATKTGERSYAGATASIEASRRRLQADRIDLIQLHNLVNERDWQAAFAADGALAALCEARDAGHVRFIGVTGHGTTVARRHRESLARFAFDSVLLPYNFPMLCQPAYAADVEALLADCRARGVAV